MAEEKQAELARAVGQLRQNGDLTVLRAGIRTEIVLLVRDTAGRHFEIAIDGKGKQKVTDADKRDPMDDGGQPG